jgi:hypothetical protein
MLQARTLPRRASMPAPPVWSTIGTPVTSALVVEPFVVPARAEPTQFYGRAATHNLIQTAGSGADSAFDSELDRVRRPRIWRVPEWEAAVLNEGLGLGDQSIWPEDEQAAILFDAYFANVNCIFPLLHPGLFRKHYFQRLYLSDNAFARVCLMVFANGARYTPSVRFTLWPGSTEASSAGWKYLRAAMLSMTSLRETPTLFGLQAAALLGFFLRGNVNTSTTWAIVGDALRSAQELGIHIRLPPVASVTELQQRELSARAFWCLYHLDRTMCVIVGRAVALLDSEVTASIPLAIDDACWDDESFPQPPPVGHVSELDAFVSMLALDRLVSTAIECIPAMPADGPGVAPLPRKDSLSISATLINLVASFNSWSRSLPPHLQWGEHVSSLPDQTFLRLAHLHARYHWAVIYVHYGGVAAGEWAPGLSFDTSTQSAQAIFGICETLLQHRMFAGGSSGGTTKAVRPIPFEFIDYALLAAAITLAAINSSALPAGKYESAMVGVNTCIATLMQMDGTSRKSGQVADLLTVMARNVGNVGVQTPVQNQQHQMPTPMSVHSAQMDAGSLTGTPYGRSVASVPSLPSSFSGGMPQTPPDQFPWIFSSPFGAPMHAHAHAHTHHPHAHGQQMYYADPSVPVTAPPVLSILIPGDGFMPTTQHSPPLSASAPASTSVSVANSSPVDSVPPQLPFAGHGPGPHSAATTHDIHDPQQHCGAGTGAGATPTGATADARWPHLLSAYVNIPPHPELHHLHLHDTPGAFAHHH